MAVTMMSPRVLLLLVLVALALSICLGVGTGNWGCANYRGFCRAACFPQEISLGPKDCAGEFVYVPIDTALTFVPFLFRPFHKNGEFKTLRLLCVKCFWIRVP